MRETVFDWVPVFVNTLDAEFEKGSLKMTAHDSSHHLRVLNSALHVADKYDIDKEVLIAACLLHDVSAQQEGSKHSKHHKHSSVMAESVLTDNDFPDEKIPLVVDAIKFHGSEAGFKDKRLSFEARALCDAEKLECLGPLGIARIFNALVKHKMSIQEIVKLYHVDGKIHRKFDAISLPELKERAVNDYAYSAAVFSALARKLEVV